MLKTLKSKIPKLSKRQKVSCFIYGCEEYCNNNTLRSLTLGKHFRRSDCLVATSYSRVKFETQTERIRTYCYEQHVSLRYFSLLKSFFESFRSCNVSLFVIDMSARVDEQLELLQSFIDFALPDNHPSYDSNIKPPRNPSEIRKMPLILVAFSLNEESDFSVLDDFDQRNCFQEIIKIYDETDASNNEILKMAYHVANRNTKMIERKTELVTELKSPSEVKTTQGWQTAINSGVGYEPVQTHPSSRASSSSGAVAFRSGTEHTE